MKIKRITQQGHIVLRNPAKVIHVDEDVTPDVQELLNDHPDKDRRNEENRQAFIDQKEQVDEAPSKDELKKEAQAEAERIASAEIVQERIKNDPYLSAIANVKTKIDNGEINENARKAIRDELS